ncbi:MAG: diguanylate cyclase [Planctomycetota bacterium]
MLALTANAGKPVLLVVDDSPAIHRLLSVKLRDEGLEFLTAYQGEEGLELAEAHQPALILLDVNMPGIDGFETLRRLKSHPETIEIPVIMLSGDDAPEQKVMCFELGATDFVTKPFDVSELRARIQSALRIRTLLIMLAQRAQVDGLTGLYNRAAFDTTVANEVARSIEEGEPLTLVMSDLDRFKRLNDTFGHQAGDAAIASFAQVMANEVRSYDFACRYGGEEFALILPGTAQEEATVLCERIRREVEQLSWAKYPEMSTTASFGMTNRAKDPATPDDPRSWVEAADDALYMAKENGRNRIERFGGDGTDLDDTLPVRLAG